MLFTGKRLFHMPLGYKLIFSYLFLIVLPVILVGFFGYYSAFGSLKKTVMENIHLVIRQISDNVHYKLDSFNNISNYINADTALHRKLSNKTEGILDKVGFMEYLRDYSSPFINMPVTKYRLSIYTVNQTLPELYTSVQQKDPIEQGKSLELYHMDRIVGSEWYKQFEKSSFPQQWQQVENDMQYGNVSLVRSLVDMTSLLTKGPKHSNIGLIRITVKISDLFNTSYVQSIGEESLFYVLDNTGKVMYSNTEGQDSIQARLNSGEYLAIRETLSILDYDMLILVPVKYLQDRAANVRNITVVICILSVALFNIVNIFISRHYSNKVTRIVTHVDSFKDGNFDKSVAVKGDDELSRISMAINNMTSKINTLIREVYLSNLQKTKAELEVLQSQISPHFLYNALSSISALGQIGQLDRMYEAMQLLANFYRLTLNAGNLFISIEKEMQQVQAYIALKKLQYGSRMEVSCQIPENILSCYTLKLILQPFVENTLKHALFMDKKIHIQIRAAMENGRIIFSVIDNGIGINRELLERIQKREKRSDSYGIWNVDERIKLQYGPEYGISIFSRQGIGTTVNIEIPVITELPKTLGVLKETPVSKRAPG